jgi:endonuclease YncB( thermonuclease family)
MADVALRITALLVAGSVCAVQPIGAARAGDVAPCRLVAQPPGQVRDVLDARTLRLADGREVRLAAIEVPPQDTPRGREAHLFLRELLTGETVSMTAAAAAPTDRYGRVVAHVFMTDEGLERSLQDAMLESGLARVAARVGAYGCATAFWAREQNARTARRGLWADPEVTQTTGNPLALLARRGQFAVVEGKVLSVRESGGTIYVNFGRRWSEDFTVTIAKRNARMFSAAGLDPQRLANRRLRVRGVIESRGGPNGAPNGAPWIEAMRPEQIEVLGYESETTWPDSGKARVQTGVSDSLTDAVE